MLGGFLDACTCFVVKCVEVVKVNLLVFLRKASIGIFPLFTDVISEAGCAGES